MLKLFPGLGLGPGGQVPGDDLLLMELAGLDHDVGEYLLDSRLDINHNGLNSKPSLFEILSGIPV
jgi:hypothetical protein